MYRWTKKVLQENVGWERTMKKSKFSEEQIAYALRQVDGGTLAAWR